MSLLSDSPKNVQQLEDQQDAVIAELDALNDRIMAILNEFSPPAEEDQAPDELASDDPEVLPIAEEVEPLKRAA